MDTNRSRRMIMLSSMVNSALLQSIKREVHFDVEKLLNEKEAPPEFSGNEFQEVQYDELDCDTKSLVDRAMYEPPGYSGDNRLQRRIRAAQERKSAARLRSIRRKIK